jgi:hypothetical protein
MDIPTASLASFEVIFEVRIGLGNFDQVLKGRGMEARSSKIRMNDDSGCVDDAAKAWLGLAFDLTFKERVEAVNGKGGFVDLQGPFPMEEFLAQPFQADSDGFDHHVSGIGFDEIGDLGPCEGLIHTGDLAKYLLAGGWRHQASSMKIASCKMNNANVGKLAENYPFRHFEIFNLYFAPYNVNQPWVIGGFLLIRSVLRILKKFIR